MTVLNQEIPDELHGRIKALAAYEGRTLKAWVTRALTEVAERKETERMKRDSRPR